MAVSGTKGHCDSQGVIISNHIVSKRTLHKVQTPCSILSLLYRILWMLAWSIPVQMIPWSKDCRSLTCLNNTPQPSYKPKDIFATVMSSTTILAGLSFGRWEHSVLEKCHNVYEFLFSKIYSTTSIWAVVLWLHDKRRVKDFSSRNQNVCYHMSDLTASSR